MSFLAPCPNCQGKGMLRNRYVSGLDHYLATCPVCEGERSVRLKFSVTAFLAEKDPFKQADQLLLLFTKIDHSGCREAISAFLTCPLLRTKWQQAWDIVTRGPALDGDVPSKIQIGPRCKAGKVNYHGWEPGKVRENKTDHVSRFRNNRLFYLSDAGTRYVAIKLGRVRATYGWRSTASNSSGVVDALRQLGLNRTPFIKETK